MTILNDGFSVVNISLHLIMFFLLDIFLPFSLPVVLLTFPRIVGNTLEASFGSEKASFLHL